MDLLSRNPFSPINDVLIAIHEAMHIGEIMTRLMGNLGDLVQVSNMAAFYVGEDGWQFTEVISPDLDPSVFTAYKDYYEKYDLYKQIVFARDPLPAVDRSSDFMDYRKWEQNPHRSEFLAPNGIYHMAGMQINVGSQLVADISLHREAGCPDFSNDDMNTLRILQRHLSLACRNSRFYAGIEPGDTFSSALRTDSYGVVIYDQALRVVYRNTIAEQICRSYDQHNGIGMEQMLADLIAHHNSSGSSSEIVDAPIVSGNLQMADHNVNYTAIRNHPSMGNAYYVVYLQSDNVPQPPLGLSQREYEVAKLAARGMSNAAISATLNISQNTIKTHLKHIMHKTKSTTRAGIVYSLFGNRPDNGAADLDDTTEEIVEGE